MNLLEAMRYLAALERHRHFGRAADACHITQPALSNAVRALEAEFGVTIVRRGRQYEGLTPEGEAVLATAHRMLHEREALRQELHAREADPVGTLSIASVPTALPVAARFAATLRAKWPRIVPAVRSLSSSEIETGIESLSFDLAFGYSERVADRGARIEVVAQYDEHYFLLCRKAPARPSVGRIGAPVSWREASARPLCMLTAEMHNRRIVDAAFASAGVRVAPAIETNSVLVLLQSVQVGDVAAVMPGALVATVLKDPELEALPLVLPTVLTPIGLLAAAGERHSLLQKAAASLAADRAWLDTLAAISGSLVRFKG